MGVAGAGLASTIAVAAGVLNWLLRVQLNKRLSFAPAPAPARSAA
jgi:hypothetical protein